METVLKQKETDDISSTDRSHVYTDRNFRG